MAVVAAPPELPADPPEDPPEPPPEDPPEPLAVVEPLLDPPDDSAATYVTAEPEETGGS